MWYRHQEANAPDPYAEENEVAQEVNYLQQAGDAAARRGDFQRAEQRYAEALATLRLDATGAPTTVKLADQEDAMDDGYHFGRPESETIRLSALVLTAGCGCEQIAGPMTHWPPPSPRPASCTFPTTWAALTTSSW
jgi:hypothetical protein